MLYGLQRAADELRAEIDKYKIIVDVNAGIVGRGNAVMTINPGSSRVVCKRYIRSYIKQAKAEADAKALEKQGSLFE